MQQKIADLCGKICETLLKAMKVKTNQLRDSPVHDQNSQYD